MSASEFGQQFINALSLGSIYALVAVGLAMVFSILRLINFAHGEVLMLGAFATFYWAKTGLPFLVVAALGVVDDGAWSAWSWSGSPTDRCGARPTSRCC